MGCLYLKNECLASNESMSFGAQSSQDWSQFDLMDSNHKFTNKVILNSDYHAKDAITDHLHNHGILACLK